MYIHVHIKCQRAAITMNGQENTLGMVYNNIICVRKGLVGSVCYAIRTAPFLEALS